MPIPLLLMLASTLASGQANEEKKRKAQEADVNYSKKTFEKNEWEKKKENERIDDQRRSALARTLQTKYNRLPDEMQMYPEIRRTEVRPSGWRTAAGALQAAGNINWDSFKNPTPATGV